jgi:cyclophilin family peptidyl-prolyl cis-trans isomerase
MPLSDTRCLTSSSLNPTSTVYRNNYNNHNISQARSDTSDISIANSDSNSNSSDIYITNSFSKIENELITYLEEKREDKKVSKTLLKFY